MRLVESFDKGILVLLVGFDVIDHDAIGLTPIDARIVEGLGTIVKMKRVWQSAAG